MRLVTYDRGGARRLGAWVEGTVVDLPDAVGHPAFPTTMEALVARNGGTTLDAARDALAHPEYVQEFSVPSARLLAPFVPPAFRGQRRVLGPEEAVPWPSDDGSLDYRVEVACVIGQPGHDLSEEEAAALIFGYTLMNDWASGGAEGEGEGKPDPVGSGGFGYAISLGPIVVTSEEYEGTGRILARVDGEIWSEGDLGSATVTFPELVARESRGRILFPGDVVGSGIFPGGSGQDLGRIVHPGAVIELEAEGIGILRNRVGQPRPAPAR
jgi:2-keto-4-pentenoate hydratase/2-oxohepta-3-ene-1,7-dioic acid hydratase in catechol pathway